MLSANTAGILPSVVVLAMSYVRFLPLLLLFIHMFDGQSGRCFEAYHRVGVPPGNRCGTYSDQDGIMKNSFYRLRKRSGIQ